MRATGPKRLFLFMITPAMALTALGACYSWKVESATLPEILARPQPPGEVRVTLPGDFQMELAQPRVDGDSVFGIIPGSDSIPRSVASSQIQRVATKQLDAGQTLLAVVVAPAAVLSIFFVAALDELDGWELK